jgi:transcription antitermination factor NusG
MNDLTESSESSTAISHGELTLPWFAVRVRSNCEQIVHRALAHKGYELFLPMYKVTRRWSDRIKHIDIPLFPGYVFCRLDQQKRLPVLSTPGVVQLVGHGRRPAEVSEGEINAVRTVLKSTLPYTPASPTPGSRVVVDRGPLMGVQGVLVEAREANRLVVSIDILNRAVAVEIDINWVRPLPSGMSSSRPA